MSLETVVEDIRDEARARAEEIREAAEAEAEEIVAEAEQEAEELRERREQEVERELEQRREQTLSSANLEAKQSRLEARRDALASVHEAVEQYVAEREEGREELTRALLADAVEEFGDEPVVVYGRGDDQQLLADLAGEFENVSVGGERDCLGGVIAESEASRVRIDNTFDSVLEAVWEDELKEVSDRLFER